MGRLSPMVLFALRPLGGGVSTQTTRRRRLKIKQNKINSVGPANIAADQQVVFISSTLQTEIDFFLCFTVQQIKIHKSSRLFRVPERGHFLG